tara:strand:- start:385 stop:603 length:219 start_codon:yes stop_codon:yes gene_type:complete
MNTERQQFAVRYENPIVNAYRNGEPIIVLESHANNPTRLHRFRKTFNVEATGKNVKGNYVILFWDNILKAKV